MLLHTFLTSAIVVTSTVVLASLTASVPPTSPQLPSLKQLVIDIFAHNAAVNNSVAAYQAGHLSDSDARGFISGNSSGIIGVINNYTKTLDSIQLPTVTINLSPSSSNGPISLKISEELQETIDQLFLDTVATSNYVGSAFGFSSDNDPIYELTKLLYHYYSIANFGLTLLLFGLGGVLPIGV